MTGAVLCGSLKHTQPCKPSKPSIICLQADHELSLAYALFLVAGYIALCKSLDDVARWQHVEEDVA